MTLALPPKADIRIGPRLSGAASVVTVRNHHKIIRSTQFRRDSSFSDQVPGN
jgi:hypothetical protein